MAATLMTWSGYSAGNAPMVPNGKWLVNFDDAQCVAIRKYGSEQAPLLLTLKQPPMGDILQMAIVRPGTAAEVAVPVNGSLKFDDRPAIRQSLTFAGVKQTGSLIFRTNLSRSTIDALAASSKMRVQAGARLNETLELSQMQSLLKVLNDCAVDLGKIWHVGGQEHAPKSGSEDDPPPGLARNLDGTLSGLLSADDYPDSAIFFGDQGAVKVALLVDERGLVADCTVVDTSSVAALDAQTCALIKQRARFKPAHGEDGRPAKGATTATITWRIR
jgi:TonB family protein